MDILVALKQEEAKLEKQLNGVRTAISALNGRSGQASGAAVSRGGGRRNLSAAARAKISRAAKARWAKFRAEQGKKSK